MKLAIKLIFCFSVVLIFQSLYGQKDSLKITDVVWLVDSSELKGTILTWDLDTGMDFKLLTGAVIYIPKDKILRVRQDIPLINEKVKTPIPYVKPPWVYAFKEHGWYHNTSGFLHVFSNGGAGIHHVMGYRFSRLLGVGIGTGIETHDFNTVRNIIPIYAEVRGFFMPKKISPYYALKIGYGIAMADRPFDGFGESDSARGGFHFSPELGLRFGSGDVSYYLGMEYKLQNVTFISRDFFGGGVTVTDKISYRRLELRTGILF